MKTRSLFKLRYISKSSSSVFIKPALYLLCVSGTFIHLYKGWLLLLFIFSLYLSPLLQSFTLSVGFHSLGSHKVKHFNHGFNCHVGVGTDCGSVSAPGPWFLTLSTFKTGFFKTHTRFWSYTFALLVWWIKRGPPPHKRQKEICFSETYTQCAVVTSDITQKIRNDANIIFHWLKRNLPLNTSMINYGAAALQQRSMDVEFMRP